MHGVVWYAMAQLVLCITYKTGVISLGWEWNVHILGNLSRNVWYTESLHVEPMLAIIYKEFLVLIIQDKTYIEWTIKIVAWGWYKSIQEATKMFTTHMYTVLHCVPKANKLGHFWGQPDLTWPLSNNLLSNLQDNFTGDSETGKLSTLCWSR